MGCREHAYIVVETEGDTNGWRAHKLMCSKCCQIMLYKDILKMHKAKTIDGEIVEQSS